MGKLSLSSKIYIAMIVAAGSGLLVNELLHWQSRSPLELLALSAMTLIATRLKVKLPGTNGTMSVNLPFLLIVAVRLSSSEAVIVAALAGLVQSLPFRQRATSLVQAAFNSATIILAVGAAAFSFGFATHHGLILPLTVTVAGAAYFLVNTIPVALVLWLAEAQRPVHTWCAMARLSGPYYILGVAVAAVICTTTQFAAYAEALALLPLMYSVFSSYRLYFKAAGDNHPASQPKPVGRAATAAAQTSGPAAAM
jgi:hypothetical protein